MSTRSHTHVFLPFAPVPSVFSLPERKTDFLALIKSLKEIYLLSNMIRRVQLNECKVKCEVRLNRYHTTSILLFLEILDEVVVFSYEDIN